jgi:twitching motility two-component system response regulator PilG
MFRLALSRRLSEVANYTATANFGHFLAGRCRVSRPDIVTVRGGRRGGILANMVQVALLVKNTGKSRAGYGHVPVKHGHIGTWEWARELGRVLTGRGNPVSNNASRSLSGLKILVVDDSKTIRRTAETLLSKEGCQVFTAIDGFDALSKIADHQPDLIFVDIMMPRLDGYQTCSLIKHNKVFRETPVIMLSSKDGLFDRARGRIVGSEQYLTKPFTKDELLGAISNQMN